ncbi:MAG: hypothetical protein K8U57_08665 [Planctomycetes bacterium]|nr:hypothetical protein [Planctomycetota bacterium]
MTIWYKIAILIAALTAFGGEVWYIKGKFELADKAESLSEQIELTRVAQQKIDQRAVLAEAALATERQITASLNQKWSKARASKSHTDCSLPADALGVLKDATDPVRHVPR